MLRIHEFSANAVNNQQAPAELEELFDILFISSGFAKLLYDPDSNAILEANIAASKLYGYSRDEFRRRTMRDIYLPDDSAASVEIYPRPGATADHRTSTRHITSDGRHIDVEVTRNRIPIAGRRVWLAEIVDITARRQSEEALRDREQRLNQAVKMEAVGRLATGIAHDFNNLLTAIRGYCDLILLRFPSAARSSPTAPLDATPIEEDVREIAAAADRAAALTRQLLAFSREQAMQIGDVSLVEIVHAMSKMLERIISRSIDMVVDVAEGISPVLANATQLEQIILNLVLNARDAMPTGGQLSIALRNATAHDGEWVDLSVSDTGTGIPDEIRSRIFEPFFTTKAASNGTGLGLATVFTIVSQLGGSISLISEVGRGTTFTVRLSASVERSSSASAAAKSTFAASRSSQSMQAPFASHHGADV